MAEHRTVGALKIPYTSMSFHGKNPRDLFVVFATNFGTARAPENNETRPFFVAPKHRCSKKLCIKDIGSQWKRLEVSAQIETFPPCCVSQEDCQDPS